MADHKMVMQTVRPFLIVPADLTLSEEDRFLAHASMESANAAMARRLNARIPFSSEHPEVLHLTQEWMDLYGLSRISYFNELVQAVHLQSPLHRDEVALIFYVGDHYEWLLGCALETARTAVVHVRNLGQSRVEVQTGQPPQEQLAEVVIHELGHLARIDHHAEPGRIMSVTNPDFGLARLQLHDLIKMFEHGLALPLDNSEEFGRGTEAF